MKILLFVAIIYIVCKGISALSRISKERARQRKIAKVKAEQVRRSAEAARLSEEFRAQQQVARKAAKRQAQIEREQIRQQVEVERERIRQEKAENTPLNKQIIERNTRYEKDNFSVDSGPVDRESLTSTYKIGLTITMTSSADHRKSAIASVRRQLTIDESTFLNDAAKELEKRVSELKPFDQIDLSPPSENDEIVYLPIEGTFN